MSASSRRFALLTVTAAIVLIAMVAAVSLAPPVDASSRGRTGVSGNPATGGQICTRCHSGGAVPEVTLTGPTLVQAGSTNGYTLTIRGGQRVAGGFDVSATTGQLLAMLGATDVQGLDDEVTHTMAKVVDANDEVSFRFLWQAPEMAGGVTLYGAGNSTNGDDRTSGDNAAAATLAIAVEGGGPTPTPAPTEPTAVPTSPYPVAIADLANPHGITVLADGQALVGEGGTVGGTWQPGQFGPGAGDGRVLAVNLSQTGERSTLVDKMTNSVDPGGGVVGANHALRVDVRQATTSTATVTLVAQAGGPGHLRPDEAAKILAVAADGQVSVFADPLAYERDHNPDGATGEAGIDSNPWRLVPGSSGRVYVVDAGANDILALDLASRELSTWAVFPELSAGQQAVPTGLAFAPDGRVAYVSLLGPFGAGTTEIRRLEDVNGDGDILDPGEQTTFIGGLKTATDVAVAHGGQVYVTEILPGTLSRIDPGCWRPGTPCTAAAKVVVAPQLPGASALTFLPIGDALVAIGPPTASAGSLSSDRVARIPAERLAPSPTPTATPESTPTPSPTTPPQQPTIYLPMLLTGHPLR